VDIRPPVSAASAGTSRLDRRDWTGVDRTGAARPAGPYDRSVPLPLPLVLVGVLAFLVLIPTRRLYLAGYRGWPLLAYFLLVLAMGLLVAELRGPARFLVPILVIAYLAPFVSARAGVARLLGRGGSTGDEGGGDDDRRPPPKDVTPPDQRDR